MIVLIMLLWVGLTLNAPIWYWMLWGVALIIKILQIGIKMCE